MVRELLGVRKVTYVLLECWWTTYVGKLSTEQVLKEEGY